MGIKTNYSVDTARYLGRFDGKLKLTELHLKLSLKEGCFRFHLDTKFCLWHVYCVQKFEIKVNMQYYIDCMYFTHMFLFRREPFL